MSYLPETLKLQNLPVGALPRLKDRVSFLHLDRVRVEQGETGIESWALDGETGGLLKTAIPAASFAVLTLGPGCSITTPALRTIYRAGTSVGFSDASGLVGFSTGRPLAINSRWARAQANLYSSPSARLKVAKEMYLIRFSGGMEVEGPVTLTQVRGLEGSRVRAGYKQLAASNKTGRFLRDTKSLDPVNAGLNLANAVLYGVALSACSAFSLNPALGFIHEGTTSALLYDIADLYKMETSIPAAFEAAGMGEPSKVLNILRKKMNAIDIMALMIRDLTHLLGVGADSNIESDLILSDRGFVPGHTNWSLE